MEDADIMRHGYRVLSESEKDNVKKFWRRHNDRV